MLNCLLFQPLGGILEYCFFILRMYKNMCRLRERLRIDSLSLKGINICFAAENQMKCVWDV